MYFVAGDRERVDHARHAQRYAAHDDERFMLDAPAPAFAPHRSVTAGPNVNSVLSAVVEHGGRRAKLFFKPLYGVEVSLAHAYGQDSLVDVALHELAAWWLARELGPPWSELVAPAVWLDPAGAVDIRQSGSVSLDMGSSAGLPEPGEGFEQLISDAAFFDALAGCQDRHDQNLRAALPARLGLIDHGYSFARPGDYHNSYPTAGFFLRLRLGQRRFALRHGPVLDYSALGPLSPRLAHHEQEAIDRLRGDSRDLLGLAQLLSADRADALRGRVERMARSGEVLRQGDF